MWELIIWYQQTLNAVIYNLEIQTGERIFFDPPPNQKSDFRPFWPTTKQNAFIKFLCWVDGEIDDYHKNPNVKNRDPQGG